MKKSKSQKLASKLAIYILAGLTIIFSIIIFTVANMTKNSMIKSVTEKLAFLAGENAELTRDIMQTIVNKQDIIINAIENSKNIPNENKLETMKNFIEHIKAEEPNILSLFYFTENSLSDAEGSTVYATATGTSTDIKGNHLLDEATYAEVLKRKNLSIIDPYNKTIDGKEYFVITIIQPILDSNNSIIGFVGSDIDINMLNNLNYSGGGFSSYFNNIICGHGTVIMNTNNFSVIGKQFTNVSASINKDKVTKALNEGSKLSFLDTNKDGVQNYRAYVPFYVGDKASKAWLSGTSISKAELDSIVTKEMISVSVITFLGLIILALFSFYIINKALKPLNNIKVAANELANGNLNVNLVYEREDEIGALSNAFINLASTFKLLINEINSMSESFNNGDLDVKIDENKFVGDYRVVVNKINTAFTNQVEDVLIILGYMNEIGRGNFDVQVKSFPGKKAMANTIIGEVLNNFKAISNSIHYLIDAATKGNLKANANDSLYNGDWQKLIQELNALLSAVAEPVNDVNIVLAELSKGNFNINISKEYFSDFNLMKISLTRMTDNIGSYISEISDVLKRKRQSKDT